MDPIFHRPKLALDVAKLLLRPSALDTRVRSGLFISGPRQTGKSTFLIQDVIPMLEAAGAIVIYVDLWKSAGRTPEEKLIGGVRKRLAELQGNDPQSFVDRAKSFLSKIGLSSTEIEGSIEPSADLVKVKITGKVKLDFDAAKIGSQDGASLSDALLEVSKKTGRDIVLIVDEVQDMKLDEHGILLMKELKAARDEINSQIGEHGYFLFVGNGSNRSMVHELTAQRRMPFYGAESKMYPPLGRDYAKYALDLARHDTPQVMLPSESAAYQGLRVLGNRPGLFQEALSTLQRTQSAAKNPDAVFDGIVNTLYDQEGKVEFEKLRLLGPLSQLIFARICQGPEEGVAGLYAGDALNAYARELELDEVTTREVQQALDKMIASGLVLRTEDRGPVMVSDPFLREIWLRRHQNGEDMIDRSSELGQGRGR